MNRNHYWRLAGLGWLAISLAGLAVGLFPQLVAAGREASSAPLPALQTLVAAQVGFLLLIYPLILAARAGAPGFVRHAVVEAAVWLALAGPFVAVGAYLGDAVVFDAVRVALVLCGAFVAAWGLAALIRRGGMRLSLGLLLGLLGVLGVPFAYYLVWEFLPGRPGDWLWNLGPASFAWSAAASRLESAIPLPLWAWLGWPAAGAALLLIDWIFPPKKPSMR